MVLPPSFITFNIVDFAALILELSKTFLLESIGTLKSTLIIARLPLKLCLSIEIISSQNK